MVERSREQVADAVAYAPPAAKPLPRRLPVVGAVPDFVPARMINEALYCERLLYLEWVQGEFEDNVFTVDGRLVHRRADRAGGDLPPVPVRESDDDKARPEGERAPAPGQEDDASAVERVPYEARSVWVSSERLGITAKIDIVEGDESGRVAPIEYKRGKPPDVPEGAYLPERAQLCAHVLLLREHGYTCEEAYLYFAAARRRVRIAIDEPLIEATLNAARRAREIVERGEMPPPLESSPKCLGCSLVGICLPDETNLLRRLAGQPIVEPADGESAPPEAPPEPDDTDGPMSKDPWGLSGEKALPPEPEAPAVRRLLPARDDEVPLYVQEQGARITLDGERLVVVTRTGGRVEARLAHTSQVAVFGNVQITTQALRALFERGIPVTFFTYGGWYTGRAFGHDTKNVELRIAQHRAAVDPEFCLRFSRGIVASKVRNARTFLRRNCDGVSPVVLGELEQLAKKAEKAESIASLLGIEGTAARVYFGSFAGMIKGAPAIQAAFDMNGRNRRPPRDPINALLSFVYAILTRELAVTVGAVGLDPLLGFYHQPRFGRPALALDLMEEFRPILADSVVVTAVNTGIVDAADFVTAAGAVAIRPAARKKLLQAYERRMDQLVAHPVFDYRVSYRRVLEVQARLLGRLLLGEIDVYPEFRTR